MNALVPIHALSSDEIDLMTTVLGVGPDGRNRLVIGRRAGDWPVIRTLATRGLMAFAEWISRSGLFNVSVTTAGARELVRSGAFALADLAIDVDLWLARLTGHIRYREDLRERWGDACAADLSGWDIVPDEPYARVATAILLKRGLIEQRGPGLDPRELAWADADALFVRALGGVRS